MSKEKDYLKFQVQRKITTLFKNLFFLLEDLKNNNTLSESNYQQVRKRILDHGNDTIRDLQNDLDQFDVHIWKEKHLIFQFKV